MKVLKTNWCIRECYFELFSQVHITRSWAFNHPYFSQFFTASLRKTTTNCFPIESP